MMAECIAVVTAGGGHDFWEKVKNGATQASRELGIPVYVRGAVDEANEQGQALIIDSAIQVEGCKGLVLAPNSKKRKKIVSLLKKEGIPTVYIDRDIKGDRVSVIQTDNFLAGKLAALEMVKIVKNKARIAVFRLDKNVQSTTLREDAFIQTAKSKGLEIVIDEYVGTRIGNVRQKAYAILKKYNDIDGVFTPNESTSMGVIVALKKLNKSSSVVHLGFDSSSYMINALKSGLINGFVVQQPFLMGYKGVYTLYNFMKGNSIKSYIDTEVIFVDNDNLHTEEVQSILGLKQK